MRVIVIYIYHKIYKFYLNLHDCNRYCWLLLMKVFANLSQNFDINPFKTPRFWRILLAGPLVFVTAMLVMAGAAVWFPPGSAKINNIVIPLVLFPGIWAALFFYACLDRRLNRAYWLLGLLLLSQAGLVVTHIMTTRGS
jgi:hypothetical protein